MEKQITQFETEDGRDSWEIEMTGGPLAERNNDLDYTYQDLVEEYWPASMAAVQYHTGEITTQYVGHSNGCRVALSSLNSYQETGKVNVSIVENLQTGNTETVDLQASSSTPVVDTFVGVACPAELNDASTFIDAGRHETGFGLTLGEATMKTVFKNHFTMKYFTGRMFLIDLVNPLSDTLEEDKTFLISFIVGNKKISRNLMDYYLDLAIDENSDFDLSNLNISKLRLYYGRFRGKDHDILVPVSDMDVIYDSVVSGDKGKVVYSGFKYHHSGIKEEGSVTDKIKEDLG